MSPHLMFECGKNRKNDMKDQTVDIGLLEMFAGFSCVFVDLDHSNNPIACPEFHSLLALH